jgi:hypothetical protein
MVSILTKVRFSNVLASSYMLYRILNSLALYKISLFSPIRGIISIVTLLILNELASR